MTSAARIAKLSCVWMIAALAAGCSTDAKPSGADAGDGGAGLGGGAGSGGSQGDSGMSNGGSGGGQDASLADASAADGGGGASGSGGAGAGGADAGPPPPPQNPWIAFTKVDASAFGQLHFVKADGTGEKPYEGSATETDPSWSPDGTKLAFVQYEAGVGNSLHVLDFAKGTDSPLGSGFAKLARPRFSPDGKTLVVAASTPSISQPVLFRVDVATGAKEQITESTHGDGGHDVGPDGTVYFVRNVDGSTYDVFSVSYEADPTTAATPVTSGSDIVGGVSVHPDGERIYFAQATTSSTQLVEMTLSDGSDRLIGDAGDEEARVFFAGDKLVVTRHSFDSDSEIAVVDLDGTLIKRLTDDTSFDTAPHASPIESADLDLSNF